MWARFRAPKITKDSEKLSSLHKGVSVNEEYLKTFRTQSYVEFFANAHFLTSLDDPSAPHESIEALLKPEQEAAVPSILESILFPKALSDIKLLMTSYFDTSAEASRICTRLLRSINETHFSYQFIERAVERFADRSPGDLNSAVVAELGLFALMRNPFSDPNPDDFKQIHDRYSSILNHLRSKRKKVEKRIKLMRFIKKLTGTCLAAVCGIVAVAAIAIAVHSLTGLLIGPAILCVSPRRRLKKLSGMKYFRGRFLRKLEEQLDAAAKGAYTLNRDFDTVSRLVARLHDEVEHNKEMIKFWLERDDKFSLQGVVKELRKSRKGFKGKVDELEEHVCLCLVTINRARDLVIKEMSS